MSKNKKHTPKTKAYRAAVAALSNNVEMFSEYGTDEYDKVKTEYDKITDDLAKKAEKLGGPFNRHFGTDKKYS